MSERCRELLLRGTLDNSEFRSVVRLDDLSQNSLSAYDALDRLSVSLESLIKATAARQK